MARRSPAPIAMLSTSPTRSRAGRPATMYSPRGCCLRRPHRWRTAAHTSKKTFSSYNRSTYKPSLTVNYDAGGSQILANGTYYLNNVQHGDYLRYNASGGAEAKSGWTVALAGSINWELVFFWTERMYCVLLLIQQNIFAFRQIHQIPDWKLLQAAIRKFPRVVCGLFSGAAQAGCLIKKCLQLEIFMYKWKQPLYIFVTWYGGNIHL